MIKAHSKHSDSHIALKAIFGGTFDPPHLGHLRPVLSVLDLLGLESCELIPSHIPVHKKASTSATHRLAMTKLLAQEDARLSVNDIEIKRDTPSFSIDTLEAINNLHPDENLCFIMGVDTFLGLPSWFRAQQILEKCHLIVMMRPAECEMTTHFISYLRAQKQDKFAAKAIPSLHDALKQLLPEYVYKLEHSAQSAQKLNINGILRASAHGEVLFVLNDELAISSTEVRQALNSNKEASKYLSHDIAEYIKQHRLYNQTRMTNNTDTN